MFGAPRAPRHCYRARGGSGGSQTLPQSTKRSAVSPATNLVAENEAENSDEPDAAHGLRAKRQDGAEIVTGCRRHRCRSPPEEHSEADREYEVPCLVVAEVEAEPYDRDEREPCRRDAAEGLAEAGDEPRYE